MENKHQDASQLMYAGKIDQAAVAYRSMLSQNAEDPMALEGMVYCSLSLERFEEAESWLGELKKVQPHASNTHWLQSLAAYYRRKPEESEREALKALELDPNSGQAHHVLGLLHLVNKKNRDAVNSLEKAAQLRPEYWQHHFNLGVAYLHSQQYPGAVKSLTNAFRQHPRPFIGWLLLQAVYIKHKWLLLILAAISLIAALAINGLYSLPFMLFAMIVLSYIGYLEMRSDRTKGWLFILGLASLLVIYLSRLVWGW